MPTLDLGAWDVNLAPSFRLKLSRRLEGHRIERRLRDQLETPVCQAFYNFAKLLDSWARRMLNELQLRFDTYADRYRAHLIRLSDGGRISEAEETSLQRDLDRLTQSYVGGAAQVTVAS